MEMTLDFLIPISIFILSVGMIIFALSSAYCEISEQIREWKIYKFNKKKLGGK